MKLHPSYIADLQTLSPLDNLWLKSSVPMFMDTACTLPVDNPCSLEVITLSDIRFKDNPTLTIIDKNGCELYVTQPILVEDSYASVAPTTVDTSTTTGYFKRLRVNSTNEDAIAIRTSGDIAADQTIYAQTFVTGGQNVTATKISAWDAHIINTANPHSTTFANLLSKPTTLSGFGITDGVNSTIQYTNPTWLAGIDASTIKTGTIDLARLPAMPSANTIVCTTIPAMSASDQLLVAKGTVVIESSTGNTYRYSGTGSVILNASYIQQSDLTPDWAVITNRPTTVSTWTNDAGYLTNASSLSWSKVTGTPSTFAPSAHTHAWSDIISGKPTTLAGYGITDASLSTHNHDATYFKLAAGSVHGAGTFLATYPTLAVGDGQYGMSSLSGSLNLYSASGVVSIRSRSGSADAVYMGDVWHSGNFNPASKSDSGHTHTFASLTSKPTTLAGYSISASDTLFDGKYLGINANAISATKLQTARLIAGTSFDGTGNISISYSNLTGLPTLGTMAAKSTVTWTSDLTGIPTTLSGYGITDALVYRTNSPFGASRLYRYDASDAYYIKSAWEPNFSGHNTWRLRSLNDQSDSQAGINTVGVDYADWANNANNVAWSGITSKPTTVANLIDGSWAGGTPYYGWAYTGANTRFGFSSSGGVVDVYADGNFYATDSSYKVWHAGDFSQTSINNWTSSIENSYLTGDGTNPRYVQIGYYSLLSTAYNQHRQSITISSRAGNSTIFLSFDTFGGVGAYDNTVTAYGTNHNIVIKRSVGASVTTWTVYHITAYYDQTVKYKFGTTTSLGSTYNNTISDSSTNPGTSDVNISFYGANASIYSTLSVGGGATINGNLNGTTATFTGPINMFNASGGITFPNSRWNVVGDDCKFGDINEGATLGLTGNNTTGTYLRFCANGQADGVGAGTGVRIGFDGTQFKIEGNTYTTGTITTTGSITTGNGSTFNGDITATSCAYLRYLRVNKNWTDNLAARIGGDLAVDGIVYGTTAQISGNVNAANVTLSGQLTATRIGAGVDFGWVDGRTKEVVNIANRVDSGWYQQPNTTTANGWPVNGSWWHMMSSTYTDGNSYYALQIAADFFAQDFRIRSTNANGTTAWSKIWTSADFTLSTFQPLENQRLSTGNGVTFASIYSPGNANVGSLTTGGLVSYNTGCETRYSYGSYLTYTKQILPNSAVAIDRAYQVIIIPNGWSGSITSMPNGAIDGQVMLIKNGTTGSVTIPGSNISGNMKIIPTCVDRWLVWDAGSGFWR